MKYAFHGAFAPYIYGLIEKKRSLGYDYYESERILRTFDEFCREQFPCETHLTAKIVMRWAEQTGTEQNLFRLNRVSVIRELARHMNSVGCQAYILPLDFTKKNRSPYPLYFLIRRISQIVSRNRLLRSQSQRTNETFGRVRDFSHDLLLRSQTGRSKTPPQRRCQSARRGCENSGIQRT